LLETLAARWGVEHPYFNGTASYPPADPTVGGGIMALFSPLYPTHPVDVSPRLRALATDHSVPDMPGCAGYVAVGRIIRASNGDRRSAPGV
jgi:hypothetical protein